jgi:hypothetical protein
VKLPSLDQGRSLLAHKVKRPFTQIIGGKGWRESGQRDVGRCSPRRVLLMPRDRRPEYKSQVRIKGRVIGLKKGWSKDAFMYFHEMHRKSVADGNWIGFMDGPSTASSKAAARADGLIAKTDSEHYANRINRRKEMGNHKESC